jgi:hypothetical protein
MYEYFMAYPLNPLAFRNCCSSGLAMQIAIMCFCKYAANFARFLSDGSVLNAWINLLIYVPFVVVNGVLP